MQTAATLSVIPKPTKPRFKSSQQKLRDTLRVATADDHARLNAGLGGLDWENVNHYRYFLEASAAALLPIEHALIDADVVRIFPDWEQRSRRRAILHDLEHIGGCLRALPAQWRLDLEAVLGTMYVLEGSRLGAKVLLTRIAEQSNPAIVAATAYLSHGSGQRLWQTFLDRLEAHAARVERGAVVAAARDTLALFAQGFANVKKPWVDFRG
jgi:heme oxygenase (biliverdin-IX-beta and delta-forming)